MAKMHMTSKTPKETTAQKQGAPHITYPGIALFCNLSKSNYATHKALK